MTECVAPGGPGVCSYGRKSRAEMIADFRAHYERQRDEAVKALATPDDDLVVTTYLGVWAQRNREVVSR